MTNMETNIGELHTKVAVMNTKMDERFDNIDSFMKRIDKAISGNGQPGLIQKHEKLEEEVGNHIAGYNSWKGKKEGADSAYRWGSGFIMSALAIVVAVLAI